PPGCSRVYRSWLSGGLNHIQDEHSLPKNRPDVHQGRHRGGDSCLRLISIPPPFRIFSLPFLKRPVPLGTLYLRGNGGVEQGIEVIALLFRQRQGREEVGLAPELVGL